MVHWIKLHSGIFQFFCWWTKNHRWYLVLNRWSAHSRHPLKRNKEIESQSIWASTIKTWVFTNYLPSSSLSWLLLQSSAMRRKFPREWLEKVKIITKENLPLYNIYPDDEKNFYLQQRKKNSRCKSRHSSTVVKNSFSDSSFFSEETFALDCKCTNFVRPSFIVVFYLPIN